MISISIILPIFNEKKSLNHVLFAWNKYLSTTNIDFEFLLCEDGSTDGTKDLIGELLNLYPCIDLSTKERRGYGGGVLAGINKAQKDYILCIDSDGQCMPDSFDFFLENIDQNSVLIGIRSPRKDPAIRKAYSFMFKAYFNLLFDTAIADPSCPYILASKQLFLSTVPYLSYMKEGFWWGFVAACTKLNINIKQIKIKHFERYDGSSVVYKVSRMPSIISRNILGLYRLKKRSVN